MTVCTITGPASWASALVNGDQSGLTVDEVIKLNSWLRREGIKCILGTDGEDERFTRFFRMYAPECDCDGGNVLNYVCEL